MNNYVLSADIGTSSLKAAVLDIAANTTCDQLRLKSFAKIAYNDIILQGNILTSTGINAEHWEAAFLRAAETLRKFDPDVFSKINAICISGNGPTLVCVDNRGNSIKTLHWHQNVPHLDTQKSSSFFLPHVVHFMNTEQELYEKTLLFISAQEWLSYRLGAAPFTCLVEDLYKKSYWTDEQISALNLDKKKFPPFAALGSIIGNVAEDASKKFGLKSGIPLVAGGPDFIMALLGSGVIKSGLACDRAGSSEGINICVKDKPSAAIQNVRVLPSAIKGLWNVSVVLNESGSIFDDYRKCTGAGNKSYDQTLTELLNGIKPPYKKENLPDVLKKITGGVCEALATLNAAGYTINEMVVSGGQSKSRVWNQIKADVCGVTFLKPEISDTELTGDAACCALALGTVSTLVEAIEKLVVIKEKIVPQN